MSWPKGGTCLYIEVREKYYPSLIFISHVFHVWELFLWETPSLITVVNKITGEFLKPHYELFVDINLCRVSEELSQILMTNQINLQYRVSALYIYIWSVLRFEFFGCI